MHIAASQGSWAALWALCFTRPLDSSWYQLALCPDRLPCHMEDIRRDMSPPCCAKPKHCFGHWFTGQQWLAAHLNEFQLGHHWFASTCTSPAWPSPSANSPRWVEACRHCCGVSPIYKDFAPKFPLMDSGSIPRLLGWVGTRMR